MKIDKVANVVVIAVAVVIVGLNVFDRLAPREDVHQTRARVLVGKAVQFPPPIRLGGRLTVVLFVSKNCAFCSASMPFYSRISSLRPRGSSAFRLLAVTPNGRETITEDQQYLAEHRVPVDSAGQIQFDALGIRATPTLALLDGTGRVFKAWTGLLPAKSEDEVIRIIRQRCPECSAPGAERVVCRPVKRKQIYRRVVCAV